MALKIERFQPEGMNVRMSGGQPSYSHVVTVSGTGKIVYTAGQLARDIDGNCVGKGDMRAQLEQTFQNLDRCLKAVGATWADVVKTNTFVTDFDEFQNAVMCACVISAWRPRPARRSASHASPVPISWSRSRRSLSCRKRHLKPPGCRVARMVGQEGGCCLARNGCEGCVLR